MKKRFVDFLCNKKLFSNQRYFSHSPTKNTHFNKMNNFKTNIFFRSNYLILAIISLIALIATFFVSNLNLGFEMKSAIFLATIFVYLSLFTMFYALQKRWADKLQLENECRLAETEIADRLLALEEAGEFFSASLKFSEMFRLISSRVKELIPFSTCALFFIDEKKANLKIVCVVGENAENLLNYETDFDKGLAGKTFLGQATRHEEKLLSDRFVIPEVGLKGLETGLAVPLFQNGEVFGVLTLYGNKEINFDENSIQLIETVATRVAPLFLSSMAFERSVTNALTDALTNLPNERAFFLVLENQIAESERSPETRPLTVLTIDIKNFTGLNQKFGHATGDQMLAFTADIIKGQLRQMDFLSRSRGDEFLAVLPTSSETIALEIIERIKKQFNIFPFEVSVEEKSHLQLNFGTASFGKDGETANQLLQRASLRKQQMKSGHNNKVLWFSKEYVK